MNWIKNKKFLLILILISTFFLTINFFFRDTTEDETEYLKEALVLSKCIKNGLWPGDYSIGLHGFLLKIPAALIFIFSGPNFFLIRSLNIIFAILSCILFYKILDNEALGLKNFKLIAITLFITNFQFLATTPTFLKEPSLLFLILLFIYELLNKKRFWLLGIILLLLLDAKEYVFLIFSPAIFLWTIITKQKPIILRLIQLFFPSAIFVLLMFTTSIIPLNPFIASILKVTGDSQYQIRHFSTRYATTNFQLTSTVKTGNLSIALESEENKITQQKGDTLKVNKINSVIKNFILIKNKFIDFGYKIFSLTSQYVQKLLFPRVFSLLSLPLIIIIPSLLTSIILFKKWFKTKENNLLLLCLIFWTYLIFYMSYTSIGRYLYPMFPIVFIFFLYLIKNPGIFSRNILNTIILISGILTILNIFYDQGQILIKILIYLYLTLGFLLIISNKFKFLNKFYIYSICFISLMSTLFFFSTQDQIANSLRWGIDRDCKKIIEEFPKDGKILINEFGWKQLPNIYYDESYNEPEWNWNLKDWVPKKKKLKTLGEKKIYNEPWESENDLKKLINRYKIDYLVFIESSLIDNQFPRQNQINYLLDKKWLEIKKIKKFQNKYFYLLRVIKNGEEKSNIQKNNLSLQLNLGKDVGQNLGSLFMVKDKNDKVIAGAGFIESHSYFIKDDNRSLQFFIKENETIKLNKNSENLDTNHTRLMSNAKSLWTSDNLVEGDKIPMNWIYDPNNNSFKKIGKEFSWITTVDNKPMKFFPNKVTYDDKEIINTKEKSSFYYSNGRLLIFLNIAKPELKDCPWSPKDKKVNIAKCKNINIPYPKTNPIAFGNLGNQIIIALNNGILLNYFNNFISIINPEDEKKGEQFYTIINYYDKLLLGEYPFGNIFSFDGKKLVKEPNNIPPLGTSGRELQTLTIYRGDIYAGVWPWGELWKTDNIDSKWLKVKRLFSQPYEYDPGIAPYRNIIQPNFKFRNIEINAWGQRIVSLTPFRNSLFISTSNKSGEKYSKEVDFVKNPKEYGAVWELKANTNISCPFIWKEKTNLDFNLYDHLALIYQDGVLMCKTYLLNNNIDLFDKNKIIGNGVYGKFNKELKIQNNNDSN